jgi:predicted lipoprotein with Yx(FWY)xxD motif
MKALRRSGLIAIALLLSILLVACGEAATQGNTMNNANQGYSKTSTNSMNNNNNSNTMNSNGMGYATPTAKSTMGTTNNMNNNNGMMGGITITPSTNGSSMAFIHTGKANINGHLVNVLMTNKGFAVYYYRSDTPFKATCTGACAQSWPPILAPQGMMTITSSVQLPKQLSVHMTPNGAQVFYDGHALYTYAADTQPGVATGRAQDMLWYLAGILL